MAVLAYFYHNKTHNYSWNQCKRSRIKHRAAVEQQSRLSSPCLSEHCPIGLPAPAQQTHTSAGAINCTHPTSSSPVSPSYPLWEKGSERHGPVHPGFSAIMPIPGGNSALLAPHQLFGLAKAHKDIPYLIGLKSYTLGNQQIKQMRG